MIWYYWIPGFGLALFLPDCLDFSHRAMERMDRMEKYLIGFAIYQAVAITAMIAWRMMP